MGVLPASAAALAVALLMLLLAMLAFQRHLLFPSPKRNAVLQAATHRIRSVQVQVPGARLQAWLAEPLAPDAAAQGLLYFNGRREHPTSVFRCLHAMPGTHVLCFRYRGLGLHWRKPGEAQLLADALAVLDWMGAHCGLAPQAITIAGRSLGSGLAVPLSAARPVRQLALISPFDEALSAIRVRMPFVRGWMLKDRFPSHRHMARVRCPVLLIVGERDRTVPPAASHRLLAGWAGHWQAFTLPDLGHRGLLRDARVQQRLGDFCR